MPAQHSAFLRQREIGPPSGPGFKRLVNRKHLDVIIALLLFLSCFAFAIQILQREGWGSFYQQAYTPALVFACTGKFESLPYATDLANKPALAAVNDFITGKTQAFDCKDLPPPPIYRVPVFNLQYQMMYLLAAAGSIWAITGVKWTALYLLGAMLAGATSVAIYGICRLFVHPPWAAAATILAILSPVNAIMLRELRDYSKAPFILSVILLCGWLVKSAGRSKQFVASAALAGIVAGIGFGVRTDLAMTLPFFGAVLLLVLISTRFRIYRDALIAGIVFVAAFAGAAFPILSAYRGGGIIGHVALLGLTTPFNEPLGLTANLYDVGHLYSDRSIFQFTEEFAFGHQDRPGDRPELDAPYSSVYSSLALEAFVTYALHFPADMVVRAYSAALQTISLNFSADIPPDIAGFRRNLRATLTWHSAALPLLFLFAAFVAWSSVRLATYLILAFAYFAGFGALQFHFRHIFYLEFWYWLSFFGLIACCLQIFRYGLRNRCNFFLRDDPRKVFVAFAVPSTALVIAVGTLMLLRAYQDTNVHNLVDQYLTAPREPVQLFEERTGDNILLRPTGELPGMSGVTADIERTPFEGYYFDAAIDTKRCPFFDVKITYKPAIYNIDFSRTIRLVSDEPGIGHIIFPAMNWPPLQLVFDGINISAEQRTCFLGLQAVVGYKSLPLPLWLQLPPDWHDMELYQSQVKPEPLLLSDHESRLITNVSVVPIPTSEWHNLAIHSFGEKAWDEIYAPATVQRDGVRIDGVPQARAAYAVRSVRYRLPQYAIVAAKGRVKRGGAAIGIMNADGSRWETTLNIFVGDFVALLKVPQAGEYRVMIANNLSELENYNDIQIYDIGLLGEDPSKFLVRE
jgi:hypothetical protein